MKHVIQIDTGISVAGVGTDKAQTDGGQDRELSWDEMVQAIDQRANYVSPVLDQILHLDHDTPPWVLRE